MRKALTLLAIMCLPFLLPAQDLLDLLEQESPDFTDYTEATFKGSRIINGHSIETRKKGALEFIIAHRFGRLNSGSYELYGLDQANVRFGLEYAAHDRLTLGVGRSSFEKTFDGFVKYKLMRQSKGTISFPFSSTLFMSSTVKTLKDYDPEDKPDFSARMVHTAQLLVARKFGSRLSLQLAPTWIHRNIVQADEDPHDHWSMGLAGRFKISQRLALNLEYHYQLDPLETLETYNSLAVGVDIETGGHVFQLHLTNSRAMIEKGFISETTGDFFEGDIHFGFNITRTFQLGGG